MKNLFKIINENWEELEKKPEPSELKDIINLDFSTLKKFIDENNEKEIIKLLKSFYEGSLIIVKNSFKEEELDFVKNYLVNKYKKKKSEFYKLKENCPNFHRVIGPEESKKYILQSDRHDYYFFPWNRSREKYDVFNLFYPKWRVVKFLAGLRPNEFENNTPKDGPIDRILFRVYPNGTGYLQPHRDPKTIRVITGIHLSQKGKDFDEGGLYFYKNNKIIDVEKNFKTGDIALFYCSLKHGVDKIISKNNKSGSRWWMCLTNPISDEVSKRTVQTPI